MNRLGAYIRAVDVLGRLRLVRTAEAFGESGVEAGGADAGGDAVAVGRKLGVVLLEHVQPLGGPLYGVVGPTQLVLPLPIAECFGTRIIARTVEPLGEPYVAFVVLQVPVVALLEEPGRGAVPATSWYVVVRVRYLHPKERRVVSPTGRRFARLLVLRG